MMSLPMYGQEKEKDAIVRVIGTFFFGAWDAGYNVYVERNPHADRGTNWMVHEASG